MNDASKLSKRWAIFFLGCSILGLLSVGLVNVIIDPCFHFHKPLSMLRYPLMNQRYINDGIVKNFEYDAIITGTSMTENFKTSELNKLFGVNSVKVPFSGASYKEINDNLVNAFKSNRNIKMVVRGLDEKGLIDNPDSMRHEESLYPRYLYDDSLLNDVNYIWNKEILFGDTLKVIKNTIRHGSNLDFDAYSNWMAEFEFGKAAVDANFVRAVKSEEILQLTVEDCNTIKQNLKQNVLQLVEDNPDTKFYFFFPPYSIYYWDNIFQQGSCKKQIDAEEYAVRLLMEYDNVHIYSFWDEYDMICNLDNYRDHLHYDENVNSQILYWMRNDTHEITEENYSQYYDKIRKYYLEFDYDSLFE